MFYTQQIAKIDTTIESLLKKVERQALDLDKNFTLGRFDIDTREHGKQKIENYIFNFKWDDTKHSRTNLSDMLKNLNQRIMLIDADLRQVILQYQEKIAQLNQLAK